MRSGRKWRPRWTAGGLFVVLVLAGSAVSRGQGTTENTTTAAPAADPAAIVPTPPWDAAAKPAAPSADGCPDGKEAPSVWSKVPPPITFPRLGGFFILPTGPGYYSLKDVLTDDCREKPPVYPWPPFCLDVVPFYDNNFRYLDDPKNTQYDWVDPASSACTWIATGCCRSAARSASASTTSTTAGSAARPISSSRSAAASTPTCGSATCSGSLSSTPTSKRPTRSCRRRPPTSTRMNSSTCSPI